MPLKFPDGSFAEISDVSKAFLERSTRPAPPPRKLRYRVEFKTVSENLPLAEFNSWADAEAYVVHRCKGLGVRETMYPIVDQYDGDKVEYISPFLLR